MRRDFAFPCSCRGTLDNIVERFIFRNTPEATSFPFPKVVLNSTLTRFSEKTPWFPARSRHDSHITELLVCILRSVTATKSLYQADDFSAFFKTCSFNSFVH